MPKKKPANEKKIFVLDTSVILYNHNSIRSFDNNDVAIPITVLEELDNFKKGNDIKNFEAREFIRIIDTLSADFTLQDWIPLDFKNSGSFKVVINGKGETDACKILGEDKPDHRILNAALSMKNQYPDKKVVLVTKDINLRLKAKSLNITAEDFETGKIKDIDSLYTGKTLIENLPGSVIDKIYTTGYCLPEDVNIKDPVPNHYFILKNTRSSALTFFNPVTAYRTHRKTFRIQDQST